jgi:branched-chain amino acid transport system substrate-binding protein
LVKKEGAQVLIGSLRSDLCLPASETAERLGAVYWAITGAAADEITTRGLKHTFRLSASASNCYSRSAIDFMTDILAPAWHIDPRNLVLGAAAEDTAFPQSFAKVALAIARERGLQTTGLVTCPDASEDLTDQIHMIVQSGANILLSAGFRNVVPKLWRGLSAARPKLNAIVGISGWAFPRDPEFKISGYDRAFALGGPYLWSADRRGLSDSSRELLERWWAHSKKPAAQDVALDRDLTFSGMYVLYKHVLSNITSADPDKIAAIASNLDIPMGETPCGYGVKFDNSGDNQRTYALVMQWQNGRRVTVHPKRFAIAQPDTRPPFS